MKLVVDLGFLDLSRPTYHGKFCKIRSKFEAVMY